MKAWRLTPSKSLTLCEEQSEATPEGNVKIKINKSLVSRPDICIYDDSISKPENLVPICSCCGMVVEVGEGVTSLSRGDRVFVKTQRFCEACLACRKGKYSDCQNVEYYGITRDGFARDFAVVQETDCAKLPDRISDDSAVFLDYIAIATQTIISTGVKKGEHLVISGMSALGLVLGQVALYYQIVPIIIDVEEKYLEKAKELGMYYTVNAKAQDPKDKIFHITGGKMAECVAHISSGEVPLSVSMDCVGKSGTLAVVGRHGGKYNLDCSLRPVIENAVTVIGIDSSGSNMQIAINMIANKAINVESLIIGTVGFMDIPTLLEETANSPDHLKKIIDFKQ